MAAVVSRVLHLHFWETLGFPSLASSLPVKALEEPSIGKGIGGLEQPVQGTQAEQDEAGHLSS